MLKNNRKYIGKTAGLLALILHSFASNAQEQLNVPLSDPGKPYTLNVGLVNGSITVIGYDGKEIQVDGELKGNKNKNQTTDNGSGMRRISSNALSIVAVEKNNKVNIHTENPNLLVNFTIKVPKGVASMKLETVNNGDIAVSNTGGEIEISNVNGSIQLTNMSGPVIASTVNGDITGGFSGIDARAPMAFSTLNGNVDIKFPAGLKANVKLKSDRGGIYTDFEIAADKSKAVATKEGTMYKLNVNDWVYGKIGGGGPEVMMKNMNGNIYLRK